VEEPVNINTVVIDYLKTLEYERMSLYHPQARVNVQISEEIPIIMGSYVHILKSIMNLVSNAVEAMPKGGTVTVRTYCEKKDHLPAREYVVVEVTDEGEGICEEDLKRIFEPFYTKKVMGRSGTGLGLAVVWTTVSDHGGFIEVESKVGEGTCFRLYFPVAETREGISEREEERVDKGNGESILVVDDVPAHLDLAKQILGEAGYTVETAESGEEALGKVRQKKYDLLLLDMLMEPNMDGLETFLEILKIHPNQKIVLMSGFIETERVKEALRLGASSFLKKPYTRRQLIDAISRAISQKEPL
jgi:CheY-like chemotaxis protein